MGEQTWWARHCAETPRVPSATDEIGTAGSGYERKHSHMACGSASVIVVRIVVVAEHLPEYVCSYSLLTGCEFCKCL